MRYRRVLLAFVVWFSGAALSGQRLAAQDSTAVKYALVTYLTASSAYVDAGTDHGVRQGDRMEVLKDSTVVALLVVAFVSSQRSSLRIVSRTAELVVGDRVRYRSFQPPVVAAADSAAPPNRPVAEASGWGGLHGRIGFRYLATRQRDGQARYSQPAVDLKLAGPLGFSSLSLAVDVRARRTSSTLADGQNEQDPGYRVYGLAVGWNPAGSPLRVTAGRQFSAPLANVNFFDGLMAEYFRPRWSAGLFAGTQPNPGDLGYSTDTREIGGYVEAHHRMGSPTRWSLTGGAVGSYQRGEINREFLFFRTSLYTSRVSGYLHQEVDYNRGWKAEAGEPTLAPTSTYASLSVRPSSALTLRGGFDNRRSIRLYRDLVSPETEFDDSFRQGYWAGFGLRLLRRYQVDLDARRSSGGSAGEARAATLALGASRILGVDLDFRGRTTRYVSPSSEGWLYSLALGWTVSAPLHVEANGGWRTSFNALDNPESTRLSWAGVDLDLRIGRRWYLLLSVHRESGVDANDQFYGGMSLNF